MSQQNVQVADHVFLSQPREADLLGAGVRLHYLEWGSASAAPIVFLHGGGLTAHTWDVVCDLLSADFRCMAVDLRGHGDSEWPHNFAYGLDDHAADVGKVVEWFGLDRFVLVGMSLGALASLTYAGHDPTRLNGLVLVDSGPRRSSAPRVGIARLRAFMDGPEEHPTIDDFVERAMAFNPLRSRERLRRSLLHNLRPTPQGTWTWKYDRRVRPHPRPQDAEARQAGLLAAARRVTCPTLVVRGGQSDVFMPEDAEYTVAALAQARMVTVDGAGHTVQGDQPYALTAALREFLDRDLAAALSL